MTKQRVHNREVSTWCCELGHVRHDDETADEVALISGLRGLHRFGSQDHLHAPRDGSAWQLGLRLLDTHLVSRARTQHQHRLIYKYFHNGVQSVMLPFGSR